MNNLIYTLPAYLNNSTLAIWLKEPVQKVFEVDGGLFNAVFHIQGNNNHIYVKHFADKAKDPNFPPLPTTALERYTVAMEVNQMADMIIVDNLPLYSAKIIGSDPVHQVIGLEAVPGIPLYDLLIMENALDQSRQIISDIAASLGKFHQISKNILDKIYKSALDFKRYKSDLQYYGMLEYVPAEIRGCARDFADFHISNSDTVILGDLNSRNVIVNYTAGRIIDFEQAQIGEGVHDLGYITAELVIADLNSDVDPEANIIAIWQIYNVDHNYDYLSFRRHLAFQVLYRLKGPSQKVWSGHLSESRYCHVVEWCTQQFKTLFEFQP